MKKLTLFLSAMLLACATNLWAKEATWTWTAASGNLGTTTPYSATLNGKAWTVTRSEVVYTGFSSDCIQLGSKKGAETVTLTSSAFEGTIKSVAVECASYEGAHTIAISVGETSYLDATATSSWSTVETKTGTGSASGNISITFTDGSRALYIKSITVVTDDGSSATLSSLTISGTPTQLNYTESETFNPAGLTVTAKYSDGSTEDVTKAVEWTITPEVLTAGTTSVTVKATLGDVTSEGYVVDNVVVIGAPQPGDAVTVTFEAGTDVAASNNVGTLSKNGITLTGSKSGNNQSTFAREDNYRIYANCTFTITSTQGKVKSVVLTSTANGNSQYGPGNYSVPEDGVGTYTFETDGPTGTWTGSAAEVVLSTSVQVRMTKVAVTYVVADPNAPEEPIISGESTFHGSTEVTITAGENLKIYYTTNGDDPTTASTLYTAPFSITATTTVKAIAVNETTSSVSDVAEKTFTHQDAITLSAIDYTTDGTKVFLQSVIVVYANDAYTYLKDETGVGLLYGGNFNFNAGDVVAGIAATTKVYSKLPELLPAVTLEDLTVTSGVAPSPAEAKAVPTAEEVNTYLLLKSVTLDEDASTISGTKLQNVTATFKDGTIDLRDQFGVVTDGTIKAGSYDVEGFVSVFNTTVQFYITKITSTATAIESVAVETPAVKTIENGQLIILRDGVKYNAMGVRLQ